MAGKPDENLPGRPGLPADGAPGVPPELADDQEEWEGCLTAEQVAELTRRDWQEPDPGDPAYAEDLEAGPPEWLVLPAGEPELADDSQPVAAEALAAGFTHGMGGYGTGFAAGGPLDVLLPGSDLGWHVINERRRGLDTLTDDELFGLLGANERQVSLHQVLTCQLVAELDRRRADPGGTPGEHVDAELAAGLTRTRWSAQALLDLARDLARLAKTRDLLAAGIIDLPRAKVIARHTGVLSDADAAKVEDLILPRAGAMTTGELASACLRAVITVDPGAARKRKEKALQEARVETWLEDCGTAAIAGRDLPPEQVILADKYLGEAARWLHAHGVDGTHHQLRAQALACLTRGEPLTSLLPTPAPVTGTPGDQPSDASPGQASSTAAGPPQPAGPGTDSSRSGSTPPPAGGTVHLVMPYDTWAGRSDNPGDIAGYGTVDADTCRTLATRMTTARWCITLTDRHGRPAAHGCARAGPGPPATASDAASWLATITIHPIQTSSCQHRRQSAGYQPSPSLRHLVKTRSPRCGFPGCRQPATRCDDDHTLAYHRGGRTCECNLYPLCRKHHRCKQSPGWHLDQPKPGQLIWTSPSGRTYTKITEPYPV